MVIPERAAMQFTRTGCAIREFGHSGLTCPDVAG
jgi:hypothetical protein